MAAASLANLEQLFSTLDAAEVKAAADRPVVARIQEFHRVRAEAGVYWREDG